MFLQHLRVLLAVGQPTTKILLSLDQNLHELQQAPRCRPRAPLQDSTKLPEIAQVQSQLYNFIQARASAQRVSATQFSIPAPLGTQGGPNGHGQLLPQMVCRTGVSTLA